MQVLPAQNLSTAQTRAAGNEIEAAAADVALRRHLGLSEQPDLATHATAARALTSGSSVSRLCVNSRHGPCDDGRAPALPGRRVLWRRLRTVIDFDRHELGRLHVVVDIARR